MAHSLSPRTSRKTAMRSPSHSKSRIYQKQTALSLQSDHTMASNPLLLLYGHRQKRFKQKITKPCQFFRDFQKKPARTPTHLGKWCLAKRYRTTHPIKAARKNLPQSTASMIRLTKRAAKFGSPYHSGKRQARYKSLRLSSVYQPVWLFISWQLAFSLAGLLSSWLFSLQPS